MKLFFPASTWAALAFGMLLLTGCAGYRLGPTNGLEAGVKSIQINIFKNNVLEPRLAEAVAIALRRTVQQDGTFRLETQDEGDFIVTGSLIKLERSALSFQPGDVLTPRDFGLALVANVKMEDSRSGKVVFDGPVSSHTTIRASADLVAAERQAVPILAQELARNITSRLVEGSW